MYTPEVGDRLTKGKQVVVVDYIERGDVYFHIVGASFGRLPINVFVAMVEAEGPAIVKVPIEALTLFCEMCNAKLLFSAKDYRGVCSDMYTFQADEFATCTCGAIYGEGDCLSIFDENAGQALFVSPSGFALSA